MTANFYKRLLQTGVILSLATVFLVFPTLLFPYITSKQLVFNILSEALLLIWLVFIWKFPAYRPKKSLITWGLLAFFGALILSCFNSVDPLLSFWGDAERMLGVFHIAHFFILYLVTISVFRTKADWTILFQSSVIIATFVAIRSFIGEVADNRAASTIGNTAYVSGYLIFNIYFAVLLFFKETDKVWRWLYALPVLIMLISFNNARTSGAIIGLSVSILLVVFLLGVLHQSKKLKIAAWSFLVVAITLITFIFSNTDAAWFQSNNRLKALTSQKATFQTRLISWKAAAQDFKNHPMLGVGFGNYALVFDKYFDAKFYDYSRGDTYFDRAHNNLIDIVSTTGLVGLVAYLSIFAAIAFYLIRSLWRNPHQLELLIIIGLFTAYFIQNLAVFDSLVTYIGLMISLAYVYYLNNQGEEPVKSDKNLGAYLLSAVTLFSLILIITKSFSGLLISYSLLGIALLAIYLSLGHEDSKEVEKKLPEFTMLTIFAIIFLIMTSRFNLAPWQALSGTIDAYVQIAKGNVPAAFVSYQAAFSHNTPLDRDGKVALINSVISNPNILLSLDPVRGKELTEYVISIAEENINNNPQDSLMHLQLAQMYSVATSLKLSAEELENYYQRALESVNRSIAASPQRIPVYFMKANILLSHQAYPEALATLNEALSYNANFGETYCHLFKVNNLMGDEKQAQLNADKCVESTDIASLGLSKSYLELMNKYYEAKDFYHTLIMAKQLVVFQPDNSQAWGLLAQVYTEMGDEANAKLAKERAMLLE